jgi:hypothetical protein
MKAGKPCTLLDLPDNGCRWPVKGEGINTLFCAAERFGRHSYCEHHHRMSLLPPLPKKIGPKLGPKNNIMGSTEVGGDSAEVPAESNASI